MREGRIIVSFAFWICMCMWGTNLQLIIPSQREMTQYQSRLIGKENRRQRDQTSDLVENFNQNDQVKAENKNKNINSNNTTTCEKCREPFWKCVKSQCIKEPVFKFNKIEVYGIFLVLVIMAATTATGVGGDIILIPIIKICFDFGSVESIALSQICTTISSFIRDSPEIDYNVSLIFLPALFLGSNIGIALSYILPNLLITILLFIVLLYSAYNSFNVGINLWQQEFLKIKGDKYSKASSNESKYRFPIESCYDECSEEMSILTFSDIDTKTRFKNAKNYYSSPSYKDSDTFSVSNKNILPIERIINNEKEYIHWGKVKYICITLFVMILSTMCIGTKDMKSLLGLNHCSRLYWILYLLFFVYFCCMIRVCINHVLFECSIISKCKIKN